MTGQKWCEQALRTVIGPDDHQLVEVLGIGKFGDGRRRHVAAIEHLVQVHLGDPARGVAGVVVADGVDHQAVENALHLDLDLVEQFFQLARLDELGDVVIGMETLAGHDQAFADLDGDRCSFVCQIL